MAVQQQLKTFIIQYFDNEYSGWIVYAKVTDPVKASEIADRLQTGHPKRLVFVHEVKSS
jgi:hypothetical protein